MANPITLEEMQEEHNLFLDKLEDVGLITQEENKDITEVKIVKSVGSRPVVELIYEVTLDETKWHIQST